MCAVSILSPRSGRRDRRRLMVTRARVAIAGGSLGGLTAALVLRDLGARRDRLRAVAVRAPAAGCRHRVPPCQLPVPGRADGRATSTASASPRAHIRYLARDGTVVHEQDAPVPVQLVEHRLPPAAGRVRTRALPARPRGQRVHPGRAGGRRSASPTARSSTVDLLVCADGVGSRSRAHLLPDVRARYSGYVAWRGMVPEGALPPAVGERLADAITYFVYANSHLLLYPIPGHDGSVAPGERLLNLVWYRNYLEDGDVGDGLDGRRRSAPGPLAPAGRGRAAPAFEELHAEAASRLWPPVAAVVEADRAAVPPSGLRRRGVTDGVRACVPHRRCRMGGAPPRGRRHGQGGRRRLDAGGGPGRP